MSTIKAKKVVGLSKVVSVRIAVKPTNRVTQYGVVRSFTRPNNLNYGIVKVGRRYHCVCDDFRFRHIERGTCKHIRTYKAKLRQRRAA